MKKKTSAAAIVVAVICSIILFPFIFLGGVTSGLVFSLESVVAPNREEEIYQSFVDNGGVDWIYDLLIVNVDAGMKNGLGDDFTDISLTAEELFPKKQVETIVYDVYHALLQGEEYQFDFSYQKTMIEETMTEYFDANIEAEVEKQIQEEYGEAYALLTESQKQEAKEKAITEARKVFAEEMDRMLEEEFDTLEKDISAEINSIYDLPEYKELKELEEETGYSLTDRTELCAGIRLAGYILLIITGILLVVLLLCHLFRPSGFFTAGAFCLVTGGLLYALAKSMQGVLSGMFRSELTVEFAEEEMPDFIMPVIDDVLGWLPAGFEKVGTFGLMAAVLLILVGILLFVIRRNKTEAEPLTM